MNVRVRQRGAAAGARESLEWVDVDALTPDPQNTKRHTPEQITAIALAIQEVGFLDPIEVDSNNVILVGEGRWRGAKEAGLKQVQIIRHTHLSSVAQRKGYAIANNQHQLNSGMDAGVLMDELDGMDLGERDLEWMGFTEDDRALLAFSEGDEIAALAKATSQDRSSYAQHVTPVVRSVLSFSSDAQARVFERFLAALRQEYPEAPTIAARLVAYIKDPKWHSRTE